MQDIFLNLTSYKLLSSSFLLNRLAKLGFRPLEALKRKSIALFSFELSSLVFLFLMRFSALDFARINASKDEITPKLVK